MKRERRIADGIVEHHTFPSDDVEWRKMFADSIESALLAERQRATRAALNGMALKCKRNIEAGMNVEFYQDVLRLVDDARIERAREARARGKKS